MSEENILKEIENIPIAFIVGINRSGTSLLQELINNHPNIVAPPEYSFITYLYPRFGNKKHWTKADILDFIEGLYHRHIFSFWLIDREILTEKLLSTVEYANYPLLCKMIFYQMAKDKEKLLLLCDKNPENSFFIKTLLKIFPEAKFIHLIRDPRDNVNSNNKSFKKNNIYFLARQWQGYNAAIEKEKRKIPGKFFTLLYEDMIANTESVLISLCGFLNVPFDRSMLENTFPQRIESAKDVKFIEKIKKIHTNLLQPINSSNIGKWKKEMSPQNVAITEVITGPLARKKYGYTLREKKDIKEKVPTLKLFKSWFLYYIWEVYTKLRYKNYTVNKKHYTKKMKSRPLGV